MMNNYERIKQMSVDEMVTFLDEGFSCYECSRYELRPPKCTQENCDNACKQWLLQECK